MDRKERTKWFLEDRFGMFIHWGLYHGKVMNPFPTITLNREFLKNASVASIIWDRPYFHGNGLWVIP